MYWWDALATVSLVHDDITTFRPARIDIVVAEGAQSGRTVPAPDGHRVEAASGADAATFEPQFLDSLNGRR